MKSGETKSVLSLYEAAVAQALLPVSNADATPAEGTGRSACATEARTGHGWDPVTEMLPVFVGRPFGDQEFVARPPPSLGSAVLPQE